MVDKPNMSGAQGAAVSGAPAAQRAYPVKDVRDARTAALTVLVQSRIAFADTPTLIASARELEAYILEPEKPKA